MNKKIEWALFIDKEGVDYSDVLSSLKERLEYSESSKTMHIHSGFGRIVEFENVVFSYKLTSMHIKISFQGEFKDYDELFPNLVWKSLHNYIECIELDVPELEKTKRSMRLKIDDEIIEREEFSRIAELIGCSQKELNLAAFCWIMIGASIGFCVSAFSALIAWLCTKSASLLLPVLFCSCGIGIFVSVLAMLFKKKMTDRQHL